MAPSNIDERILDTEMCVTRPRMQIADSRDRGIDPDAEEQSLACMLNALAVHWHYKRFMGQSRTFNRVRL
jgi:hypothetical protein